MRRKPTRESAFRAVCVCCGQKATAALCLGCLVESNADCPCCRVAMAEKRDSRAALALSAPASLRDALSVALDEVRNAK
jgi:hypothetical protein